MYFNIIYTLTFCSNIFLIILFLFILYLTLLLIKVTTFYGHFVLIYTIIKKNLEQKDHRKLF